MPLRTPVESVGKAAAAGSFLGSHCAPDYLSDSFKRQVGWSPHATRCMTASVLATTYGFPVRHTTLL